MRTPGERTSGAWTGGCVIHPDGGDETDRTAGKRRLRKLKEELEAEIAAEGDTSLLDNTYVAFFDGR